MERGSIPRLLINSSHGAPPRMLLLHGSYARPILKCAASSVENALAVGLRISCSNSLQLHGPKTVRTCTYTGICLPRFPPERRHVPRSTDPNIKTKGRDKMSNWENRLDCRLFRGSGGAIYI
jgi:hypothetical protein